MDCVASKKFTEYTVLTANNGKPVYRINNSSRYRLISSEGIDILNSEYDAIEAVNENYIKVKRNGTYGIMTYDGKEIIPISRGYTSIGDYNSSNRTFAFTKKGMKGVCNASGIEISKTRLAPTADDIKENGNYSNAIAMTNGGKKYYKVSKNEHYGLTDTEGRLIVPIEMEALESAGTGYLKFKLNGFWGLMDYAGKIIIDTSRGYTSIGDFVSFTKRFPYTMTGYKGECDLTGKEISRIRTGSPTQSTASNSSNSSSSSSNSSSNSGTQTIIVEQHGPVQVWVQCNICYGSGSCNLCNGSGWDKHAYANGRYTRCISCGGNGRCSYCSGRGGRYETQYR